MRVRPHYSRIRCWYSKIGNNTIINIWTEIISPENGISNCTKKTYLFKACLLYNKKCSLYLPWSAVRYFPSYLLNVRIFAGEFPLFKLFCGETR